jgi:hypothetical protein
MADNLKVTNNRLAEIRDLQAELNRYVGVYMENIDSTNRAREEEQRIVRETNAEQKVQNELTKEREKRLKTTKGILKSIYDETVKLTGGFSGMWKYLNDADISSKSLVRSMGLNTTMTATMNGNLRQSAMYAAQMGVSFQELAKGQMAFAETTGTMALLNIQTLEKMSEAAGATGLNMEQQSKFFGQLQNVGIGVGKASTVIEKTMKSSQAMGLNMANTLKMMTENMSMMNKFRFENGVDGFKQMAQFAQQQKMSMEGAAATLDKFQTLEGSIEASARLFTMGGEFANADAFSLGFNARNNPEVMVQQVNDMMKGLAVQDSKGVFKVSAVDMDRLRVVSEITGQSVSELREQAVQLSKQQFVGKNVFSGVNKEDRDLIANLMQQDDKGVFTVKIDNKNFKLNELGATQISLLKKQAKSTADQAKATQDFNAVLTNSIDSLKANLLPLLNVVNSYLGMVNNIGTSWVANIGKVIALAGPLLAGKAIIGGASSFLGDKVDGGLKNMFGLGKKSKSGSVAGDSMSSLGNGARSIPEGSVLQSKAAGIAAIGVAALGIGGAIWLAADGTAKLADSISKLNIEQMNSLAVTMGILGATIGGTLVASIYAVGIAGSSAAVGLLAVGAAAIGIGAGIGVAAYGIGSMVENLSKVDKVGDGLANLGKGILMLSSPSNIIGIGTLASLGGILSTSASGFNSAGNMFRNVGEFMSKPAKNLIELQNTVKALKEFDGNSMLSQSIKDLKEVINKGIEIKLPNNGVLNVTTNVDLYIDRDKLATSLQIGKRTAMEFARQRLGTNAIKD